MFSKAAQTSPIGIDVGRRSIKAIQLETSKTAIGGWRIRAAATIQRTACDDGNLPAPSVPSAAEVRQLMDVLERQGFKGNKVILAATDKLVTSILELPPMASQAPVEQISRMELARTLKCAPDSFELGVWDLPAPARAQKATHVMAAAMPHVDASALLDVFETEGFDVAALDVRNYSIARACAAGTDESPEAANGITALLDIGWCAAELALLYHGKIIYVRTLPEAGLARLRETMISALRIEGDIADYSMFHSSNGDAAEELSQESRRLIATYVESAAQELLASFSYAVHQYPDAAISRLLLVGGGAAIPDMASTFEAILGFDSRAISPATLLECGPGLAETCASPSLTVALGLAQYPEC